MDTGAARTDTFLGQRYRRLAKRMPKAKVSAASQRWILVIIFHLLADPLLPSKTLRLTITKSWSTKSGARATWSTNKEPSAAASPLPLRPGQRVTGPQRLRGFRPERDSSAPPCRAGPPRFISRWLFSGQEGVAVESMGLQPCSCDAQPGLAFFIFPDRPSLPGAGREVRPTVVWLRC